MPDPVKADSSNRLIETAELKEGLLDPKFLSGSWKILCLRISTGLIYSCTGRDMVLGAVPAALTDGPRELQEWLARQVDMLASDDAGTRKIALGIIHQLAQDPRSQAPLLQTVLVCFFLVD